jgi:adenylate kinase family enzyme
MQRVSVVGNSGSGKSRLAARLAETLAVPYIELDSIHHLADWQPIDPDRFLEQVAGLTAGSTWVIDGNYRTVVVDGPVWERADTVVWLDLPRRTVMRQVIGRTLRRTVRRDELWNGNREPLRNLYSWDPHKSVIRWSWTQHAKYRQRFAEAMSSPRFDHLDFVRLTSHADADRLLHGLTDARAAPP